MQQNSMTAGTSSRSDRDEGYRWTMVPAVVLALLALTTMPGTTNTDWFVEWNRLALALPHSFWAGGTTLGSTAGAFALLAGGLAWRPRWVASAVLALPVGTLYTQGLKKFVGAARPAAVLDPHQFYVIGKVLKTASFPSGHSATAFAVAASVALCSLAEGRRWIAWVALAVAAFVAFSRVAVGAHWPLDIFAGGAGGWLCGVIGVWWSARWRFWATDRGVRLLAIPMAVLSGWLLFEDSGYPPGLWMQYALGVWGLAGAVCALGAGRRRRGS
jgi:membrane-associated phospholipid phosphatase